MEKVESKIEILEKGPTDIAALIRSDKKYKVYNPWMQLTISIKLSLIVIIKRVS
jgi:hypothetical protein